MRCNPMIPRARAFVLLMGVFAGAVSAASADRRFTVEDSIGFSTFLNAGSQWEPSGKVRFSPDGRHFLVATMRGDLTTGKREATLWLFDNTDVRDALAADGAGIFDKARKLVSLSSASNREPIGYWRWSSDSKNVLFLGADDDGAELLYRISTAGGNAVALSRADQDVSSYDERGGAVVYLAHKPIRARDLYQAGGPDLPDIEAATGKNILPLLFPNWFDAAFHSSNDELWRIKDGTPVPVTASDHSGTLQLKDAKLALSNDGHSLVVTRFVPFIPKSWERYQPLQEYPGLHIVADTPETAGGTDHYRPRQYAIVDMDSGSMSNMVEAPIEIDAAYSTTVSAAWSSDNTRVALPGSYPALGKQADQRDATPVLPCAIAIVDVRTKAYACAKEAAVIDSTRHPYSTRKQLVGLAWQADDKALVAQYAAPESPGEITATALTPAGSGWTRHDTAAASDDRPGVAVVESLDTPPKLVADADGPAPRVLLDPNPQLHQIALGETKPYAWRDADGDPWTGALVKPPGFSSQRRYPLVIQTHNLDRSRFLVDGPSATGFSALALAGKDIVVLQVDETNKKAGTPGESEAGAAGYRAAIKQLVNEGVVDPAKVGIITWSHMGPYASQALVDEPHAYAAATFAEAAFNGYVEYLLNIDYMGTAREKMFRAQFGPKPFGDGLKAWTDHSTAFQTDRICTPILFQSNSPPSLLYGWDIYAALRAQDKPADLFYIRNGDHVLVNPRQRLAEQGMNVDWYDYWLNGHKDSDPAKSEQYRRWDAMKPSAGCQVAKTQ